MFGQPVRIRRFWTWGDYYRWADEHDWAYGVRKNDFNGQAIGSLAQHAREHGYRVQIDAWPTAAGFRYVRWIERVNDEQEQTA